MQAAFGEDQHAGRKHDDRQPRQWAERLHVENSAAKGNDEHLTHRDGAGNGEECRILQDAMEAADLGRQRTAVDLVPHLEEHVNREEQAHLKQGEIHCALGAVARSRLVFVLVVANLFQRIRRQHHMAATRFDRPRTIAGEPAWRARLTLHQDQQREHDHDEEGRGNEDVAEHRRRDDVLIPTLRRHRHHSGSRRLGAEGDRRERVHDDVDPQQLQHRERGLHAEDQNAQERDRQSTDIDRQLELDESLDVLVQRAAPLDRMENGRERIVEQHDLARLLGDFRAGNAHSQPDVGFLQGGRIVGAVAGDRHHLAEILQ